MTLRSWFMQTSEVIEVGSRWPHPTVKCLSTFHFEMTVWGTLLHFLHWKQVASLRIFHQNKKKLKLHNDQIRLTRKIKIWDKLWKYRKLFLFKIIWNIIIWNMTVERTSMDSPFSFNTTSCSSEVDSAKSESRWQKSGCHFSLKIPM